MLYKLWYKKQEYKKCHGKFSYDKKSAQSMLNLRKKSGHLLRIYHCPTCNLYHLTKIL